MDRRDFLKLAGITGLAVGGPALARAFAEGFDSPEPTDDPSYAIDGPTGLFFVQIQATGGWEPTMLCDPKPDLNGLYDAADVNTVNGVSFPVFPGGGGEQWQYFFEGGTDPNTGRTYNGNAGRMTVFNGVDIQTNSHDAGRRHMASGHLTEGDPALPALIAGFTAPHLPMAFLTFGGYEMTEGTVAPTRDLDRNRLSGISYPARIDPTNAGGGTYNSPTADGVIKLARNARLQRQMGLTALPKRKSAMDTLMTSRLGSDQLKRLEELLDANIAGGDEGRIQLAIAAYRAGIGTSVNLSRGGFDTHGNHDQNHSNSMSNLLELINTVWFHVDQAGIAQDTVMCITSDFGRSPNYNGNMGKDHWPVSSMIVVTEKAQGGRTVGTSDDGHRPIGVNPNNLNPDEENGTRITPTHVHRAIRDLVGMAGTELDTMFPMVPETPINDLLIPA
jgi:hypothetical protein